MSWPAARFDARRDLEDILAGDIQVVPKVSGLAQHLAEALNVQVAGLHSTSL